MQKTPFSRLYSLLEKSRHSHVLDESLQIFDSENLEQPIVKPLYSKDSSKSKTKKNQDSLERSINS